MRISGERRARSRQSIFGTAIRAAAASAVAVVLVAGFSHAGSARWHVAPAPTPTTGLVAIELGKPAPDFAYDLGTGPKHLSDSRGTLTVIHFWNTWCEPCTEELPLFVRLRKDGPPATVITLSNEDPGVARKYLEENAIDLPVSEDASSTVFKLYTIPAIPVTVIVRPNGNVGYVSVGEMGWEEFSAALQSAQR